VELYLYSIYNVVLDEAQGQPYLGGGGVMLYLKIPCNWISALHLEESFVLYHFEV
jgi:hypothetical protein